MRYVLVCNINGEAAKLNEKLYLQLKYKFNAGRSKLGSHFTIKVPFETDEANADELKEVLNQFSDKAKSYKMNINGFGKFREDVVYMPVEMSKEALIVHDALMQELQKFKWLKWKANERKNKVFHCTIVSKRVKENFKEIWKYVNKHQCNFQCEFDNIVLYKWEKDTWIVDQSYKLNSD